jgi:aryl-alcohol dehydrogenase-like predicted oxidoreductase
VVATTEQKTGAAAAGTISLGDLTVNRMGFGAMRITGRGVWGEPSDRAETIRVLRRAVELGVDFIDTADSYGPNVSEEIIAEALHPYPAGLVIATKGGFERSGPDEWSENGRPEHLRRALEGSLRRLKLERIDLWQLHRIDSAVPEDEQFGVLAEFVREGKVKHVGLSEVGVEQIQRARAVLPIVSVQNMYNVAERGWEEVVDYCERERIAFIPWYPLGAGALDRTSAPREKTARGTASGEDDGADRLHAAIARVAARRDATPLQVALAWLLARSPMMLVIPGTSNRGRALTQALPPVRHARRFTVSPSLRRPAPERGPAPVRRCRSSSAPNSFSSAPEPHVSFCRSEHAPRVRHRRPLHRHLRPRAVQCARSSLHHRRTDSERLPR